MRTRCIVAWGVYQLVFSAAAFSQPASTTKARATSLQKGDEILAAFGNGEVISRKQFEHIYLKHNPGRELRKTDEQQLRAYLSIYLHSRQKVFQARALGLDTVTSFQSELRGYISQLAQSYLIETEVLSRLIAEAFDRSRFELRASHILVALPPGAPPEDTLRAYRKALSLRDSVVSGHRSFLQMAMRYSDDLATRVNGGDLGFFSALDMLYPFETGAYSTPVGSISAPVRSSFGYHLIWVRDRIPNLGVRRAAHVVVMHTRPRVSDSLKPAVHRDTAASFQRIGQLYIRLRNGEAFDEIVRCCSEDESTRAISGDLGTGRLLPALEEAKRFLAVGEYTQPIYTQQGWHILKLTQMSQHPGDEQTRNQLKHRIIQNERVEIAKRRLVTSLRKSYGLTPDLVGEKALLDAFDELAAAQTTGWPRILHKQEVQPLFAFAGKRITIGEFVAYCTTAVQQKLQTPDQLHRLIDSFTDKTILQHAEQQLPYTSTGFRELSQEYQDGLLLFAVMEKEVWRPAIEDTTGLRRYFEQHKADFQTTSQTGPTQPQQAFEEARADVVAAYQNSLEKAWIEKLDRLYPVTLYEKAIQKLCK